MSTKISFIGVDTVIDRVEFDATQTSDRRAAFENVSLPEFFCSITSGALISRIMGMPCFFAALTPQDV